MSRSWPGLLRFTYVMRNLPCTTAVDQQLSCKYFVYITKLDATRWK